MTVKKTDQTATKIKRFQLVAAEALLQKITAIELPPLTALALMRVMRVVRPELADFETVRSDLVKKYGGPEDKGKIEVLPENLPVYESEITKVLDEALDLDIVKVPFALITFPVSANELLMLEWMIEIDPHPGLPPSGEGEEKVKHD